VLLLTSFSTVMLKRWRSWKRNELELPLAMMLKMRAEYKVEVRKRSKCMKALGLDSPSWELNSPLDFLANPAMNNGLVLPVKNGVLEDNNFSLLSAISKIAF